VRIAITGASGNGKTTLARELERVAALPFLDVEALEDEERQRALQRDDWVTDATLRRLLGTQIVDRADVVVWLDRPAPLVLWRLVRRERSLRRVWTTVRSIYDNRCRFRGRYVRLRTRSDVREFVQAARRRTLP
jgi:adenylate kinase family enzyme